MVTRVFVGIPTYNRPVLVRATISSVLAQSLKDLRIVVSDNASEHQISAQVETFVRETGDRRLSFFRQQENGGEYGQGRFFFSSLRDEEYFVILHDDDEFEQDYLQHAVQQLDSDRSLDLFVANPTMIDERGMPHADVTAQYHAYWGRPGQREGSFDVLDKHMECGFAPISGTVFRVAALRQSGFVDQDCSGSFPFESNVFLRLGEQGARGWFCPDSLLRFGFHSNYMVQNHFLSNPQVVENTIRLYERRRFTGKAERRRRQVLGRLHRVNARHLAKKGDYPGARSEMLRALRANPRSWKCCAMAPLMLLAPGPLAAILPAPSRRKFK